MKIKHLVPIALSFGLAGAIAGVAAQAQSPDKDQAAAIQEVQQTKAAMTKLDINSTAYADMVSENLVDIHPSGWLYGKSDNLAISRNLAKMPKAKVIYTETTEQKLVALDRDNVVETALTSIYYAVPNPQDEARKAGTLGFDPAAEAKADAAMKRAQGMGPGEMGTPNPYRIRSLRVWHRSNGHWIVAVNDGTVLRQRAVPGRF